MALPIHFIKRSLKRYFLSVFSYNTYSFTLRYLVRYPFHNFS